MNSKSCIFALAFSATAALLQAAEFTDVTIRQRWPWSQKVDISYTLLTNTSRRVSIALYSNNTKLTIPDSAFSGDLFGVQPGGPRKIVFDPSKTSYTNQILPNVRAELTSEETPIYMIVDLTKSKGADGLVTYLTAYDITNSASTYGDWEMSLYQTNGAAVLPDTIVWTGVTNNSLYASNSLVLRFIPAGTFLMGSPSGEFGRTAANEYQKSVTLTKGFFIGIYELTQQQYYLLKGTFPGQNTAKEHYPLCPVSGVNYNTLRGDSSVYNWPTVKAVQPDSYIGKIRALTDLSGFDLPTDAQWEYACRAGLGTSINTGFNVTVITSDPHMGDAAWYATSVGGDGRSRPAGRKLPNGWGLYDMHGNVWEWCLDWFDGEIAGGTNPLGPTSGTLRVARGGSFYAGAQNCRCAQRSNLFSPSSSNIGSIGFRLALNINAE